eukprot:jgi/Undpi1/1388/HiC_scaffold_11.g04780.m1
MIGNIGEVLQLSECEYDIKIRPDTNNGRHRLWFYFAVSNTRPQQQVLLNIVNFSKRKSLYREGLAPVVCSRRRPQWNRIPSTQVLYYRSPKGPGNRMAYVMSFLFQFDGVKDAPYYFAYSFPYTYTDLQRYLYSLERQEMPFFRREILSRTLQQRRVELLTITAPDGEPGARPFRDRKWVFMSARVHPGETPAQFIVHGAIDFLTSESPRARALRANVVFKIVPMLNPDGVVNGNYRCSYLGFDLNRHWLDPSAWAQPEILSVKNLVATLHEDPSVDLDFYVAAAAAAAAAEGGTSSISNGMTNRDTAGGGESGAGAGAGAEAGVGLGTDEGEALYPCGDVLAAFPRMLELNAPDFSFERSRFDSDPNKEGTGRRALGQLLSPDVLCFTLEVSFYASHRDGVGLVPYTRLGYVELGR